MSNTLLKYIIRRTGYSVLIVAGVVLLTFLLFNLCSGDPAAAVLGKNATPAEIESLRRELGSDLPLFFGRLCRSAAFAEFSGSSGEPHTFVRQLDTGNITACAKWKNGEYQECFHMLWEEQ